MPRSRKTAKTASGGRPVVEPDRPPVNPYEPHCFLICPFDDDERLVQAQDGVRAAARDLGFDCYRVDQRLGSTDIIGKIRDGITWATFVVADLSLRRPNCFYEIGFADAVKRPIVLIAREKSRIPFDVAGRSILFYKDGEHLRRELRRWVLDSVLFSHGPEDAENQNLGQFGRSALANGYLLSGYMTLDLEEDDDNDDREGQEPWDYFHVFLTVRSAQAKRPLVGHVTFQLHESFSPRTTTVRVRDGVAKHDFWCYGWFTVGAVVRRDRTRLELDLRWLPGASDTFRSL
jgi:hypothetical protein